MRDDGPATGEDRGQAMTLEAVTAAILILAAIGFALQATAVTPLSASTSSQHVENQLQSTAEGILASSAESGALEEAVMYWNVSEQEFHGSTIEDRPFYAAGAPPNEFGDALDEAIGERNVAFNVYVHYQTASGDIETMQMVRQGEPSDHAVSASRAIELTNETRLVEMNFTRSKTVVELDDDEFYVEQRDSDGLHYNLVRVEVVAWRI